MMMTSDPIADMLTRIRNANTAKHDTVDIPASKIKVAIAGILLDEGYITKYDIIEDGNFKTIRITLKYGYDDRKCGTFWPCTASPASRACRTRGCAVILHYGQLQQLQGVTETSGYFESIQRWL